MVCLYPQSNVMPDENWFNAATAVQSIVLNLWTVYLAIAAATLALITSGRKILEKGSIRILIAGAYFGSAVVNLLAMLNLRTQHDILARHITDSQLQWHMLQPRPWEYIVTHLVVDVGIVIAVLVVPERTRAKA